MKIVYLFIISLVGCTVVPNEGNKTAIMSPCQCFMDGGCSVQWTPKEGMLYNDGTDPAHYDKWGQYSGPLDIPKICKKDQIDRTKNEEKNVIQ